MLSSLLPVAVIAVLVLLALAIRKPPAAPTNAIASTESFETPHVVSMRERQVDEESHAIADLYRRRANEIWQSELKSKAAVLLSEPLEKKD